MNIEEEVPEEVEEETEPETPLDPEEDLEQPAEEAEEEEEEFEVSFGDEDQEEEGEAPEKKESEPFKVIRKKNREYSKKIREKERENRELKARLEALEKKDEPKLGEKPTLESCDFDSDLYESKYSEWVDQKRKHDQEQAKVREAEQQAEQEWTNKVQSYEARKSEIKYPDFEDAESLVLERFSQTQQGIILQGAQDPATLVYALGKNEKKLEELAKEPDPIKFAFKVSKLESKMKVTQRKAATKPEKALRTAGTSVGGSSDKTLDRLREEAAARGDYSKVAAYKRQLKAAR